MENIGIVDLEYRSCASLTIQCLAETGIADRQTAFRQHIENAILLGLMPDDLRVIKATLADYGFIMQSTRMEGVRLLEMISFLSDELNAPATVLVNLQCNQHPGGYMLALQTDGIHSFNRFLPDSQPEHLESHKIIHIWIRWDDGIDRSPYPRKSSNRSISNRKQRIAENTDSYQYFQPNPCDNRIGDCVVRGISGVLDISWMEAMNRLSSTGETTVNSRTIYPDLLMREGFIQYKPITQNGHRLNGIAFCQEMEKQYHCGERIFAHVGRCHVAAIVPTNGTAGYKIIDSWNSSQRWIGEYWVKPAKTNRSTSEEAKKAAKPFHVGDVICHPSFGKGVVTAVTLKVLTVDFDTNGSRRIGEDWARKNCTHIATQ